MILPAPSAAAPSARSKIFYGPNIVGRSVRPHFWAKSLWIACVLLAAAYINTEPVSAVVGGTEATLSQRNWVVGVALADVADGYYAQFCGGTLLAPDIVVTAAHCTFDKEQQRYEASELHVLVNRLQLSSHQGERIPVLRIVRHPGFDMTSLNDDIALLILARDADAPVLPIADLTQLEAQSATVFGWGVTEDGTAVDWLRQADLPLVNRLSCNVVYKAYGISISQNMVCAGNILGGVDACTGDSGGPLVVFDAEHSEWKLAGIVSWGAGCGSSGAYGVYTRASAYTAWIAQETQ